MRVNFTQFPFPCSSAGLVLLAAVLVPEAASAQLTDATWIESINLQADATQQLQDGSDENMPEPQNTSIEGFTYAIDGAVSFDSPGPPNATATINAEYQSALSFLGGSSSAQIDFQFRVVEVSTPPVSVSMVPVMISAAGDVAAASSNPSFFATALASVSVWLGGEFQVGWDAIASNSQGTDAFNEATQIDFAPNDVVDVNLTANCGITAEVPADNSSASASAHVDPVIVVANELIPGGGGASYPDYYTIQLSNGYWALGQTPALPTTWGDLKRRYSN